MNDIVKVEISRSQHGNLRREAIVDDFIWRRRSGEITLVVWINFLTEEGEIISTPGISPFTKNLVVSNSNKVNTQGIVIPKEEYEALTDEEKSIYTGEYDFYISMVNAGPIDLFELFRINILAADHNNRFNI